MKISEIFAEAEAKTISPELLAKIRSLGNKEGSKEQPKEISKDQPTKNESINNLYARAEIYADGYPILPRAKSFASKVFKMPEQLKEFESECLKVYEGVVHSNAMFDNSRRLSPKCKIIIATKNDGNYKKVGEYESETDIGIKKILQQKQFTGGKEIEQKAMLTGSIATFNVYVEGTTKDNKKINRIDIVKNAKFEKDGYNHIGNEVYKSIMRKLSTLKTKLLKLSDDKYDDWYLKDVDVITELNINNKTEGSWSKGLNFINKSKDRYEHIYGRFEPLERLAETYAILAKEGIIKEEFKYFRY